MGLFSKTVLSQSAQTLSLIEDTPELVKPSIVDSIFRGSDLTLDLTNNIMNSFSGNIRRYYTYGRDKFTNGLPEGSIGNLVPDTDKIQDALVVEFPVPEGHRIRQDTAIIDGYDVNPFCRETLRNTTDWNPSTFDITYQGLVWTALPANAKYVSPTEFSIVYQRQEGGPDDGIITVVVNHTVTSKYLMDETKTYYYISFTELDVNSDPVGYERFWVYDPTSEDYPTLDIPVDVGYTQYMPVVPLRVNNVSLTDDAHKDTPLYKTSKKLLNTIELKIEELDEGVNQNPDIKDVDHAYVIMAVSLHTEKPESIAYIYDFFDDLEDRDTYGKNSFEKWEIDKKSTPPINIVNIKDGTYNVRMVYYYIDKTSKKEVIGKVGTTTRVISGGRERLSAGENSDGQGGFSYENPANVIVLKRQVTADSVDIVTVSGAIFVNNIYGGRDFITGIEPTEEDNFLIPLNLSVSLTFNILDRNVIYYDSLKVVFHAYQYTKLKWYQTGFFQFVVIVIAVALTIVTGYGGSLVSGLIGAASAGAVALLSYITQQAIIAALVSYGFKLVAQELGVEFAAILAAIAIAYGISGSDTFFQLPMASEILFIGTAGLDAVFEVGAELIADAYAEFNATIEQDTAELEAAQEKLETNSLLDPMGTFTSVNMLPGETPGAFVDRSLMVNQGISSIDMVSNFVEAHLLLPTPESYYG